MNRPTSALPLSTRPSDTRSTVAQSNRRLDIQGLRAVAVIAVVIYHADVPLSGGFVGVDMFFVISGYVITLMLVRELKKSGTINFRQFFVRRFLRLTPALSLVVIATLVGSFFLQSPLGEQKSTAATGAGALLMVANFVIFRATGGYFEPAADSNPLLHTWSLAVEEQFYLVFPVLLFVAWRWGRRSLLGRICVLVVLIAVVMITLFLTLSGAIMGSLPLHPFLTSYYSPLLRTWEFGAGVAIAFMPVLTAERQRISGAILSAYRYFFYFYFRK
jgi:peptidoglycan/LPS O-acetylase OafA/YrhL